MKKIILIHICIVVLQVSTYAQLSAGELGLFGNSSDVGSRNVNHPYGVKLQDFKRSSVMIVFLNGEALVTGSGTLVNTVLNTYNESTGKQYLYILTAEHVTLFDDEATKRAEMYISFDFEIADAVKRTDDEVETRRFHKVVAEEVMGDEVSDMQLLKVLMEPDFNSNEEENAAFYHAYAAGWNFKDKTPWGNISHPKSDLKKVYTDPENVSHGYEQRTIISPRLTEYSDVTSWNGLQCPLEGGSSGSAMIGNTGQGFYVSGVYSGLGDGFNRTDRFYLLKNSWFFRESTPDSPYSGLINFLDPNQTWISNIPGGYVKDLLRPANVSQRLSLSITPENNFKKEIEFSIPGLDRLPGESNNYSETILGLKLFENTASEKVFLTVEDEAEQYLFYGVYADNPADAHPVHQFQAKSWNTDYLPPGFKPYAKLLKPGFEKQPGSNSFKERCVNYKSESIKKRRFGFDIPESSIKQNRLKAWVKMHGINNHYTAPPKVMAISHPFDTNRIPVNVMEYFQEGELSEIWASKKYHNSFGATETGGIWDLYIDRVSIFQDQVELSSIESGFNGGYLNLVNSDYQINVLTSFQPGNGQKIVKGIDFSLQTNEQLEFNPVYYAVWIDFLPGDMAGDFYTFGNTVANGSSGDATFNFSVDMPDQLALGMNPGDTRLCRMRVAVSNQNNLTEDGQYQYGEVEDYLVKIRVPTAAEVIASAATLAIPVRAGIQPGQGNSQCGVPAQEPAASPAGTPVNVGDATYPYSCNSYVCASSTCVANAANSSSPLTGEYSVCISGSADYIALDEGDQFIHNAFNNRTVSFWLNNTDDPGIEEVYDEGGSTEGGMGIRINNNTGKLELGVRNGTAFKIISAPVAATTWLHVVASFENGKLSLYQNGTLAASDNAVGFTTVPVHNDGAAFGGTNGTNVFGSVNRSYHGCADEILIFDKALTLEQVDVLYQAGGPGSTANPQAKQPETQTGGHLVTDMKSQPAASLIIYPNPSKGDVNVITEVKQAGPV
ncbi:MAG: LamG-like jellyroll fold domain-containing protein, partial [Bacteroidota bacterium]